MSTTQETRPGADPSRPIYWAFISYSHHDDRDQGRQWATWLHQAIERYEVPSDLVGKLNRHGEVIPSQIYPVFRDTQELSASPGLHSQLRAALKQSRRLVVICSPQARESTHVRNEVTFFKQLGRGDRIHPAIVSGRPNISHSENPGDAALECFPEPLLFVVDSEGNLTSQPEEPMAADFRSLQNDSSKTGGWTSPQAYREALEKESATDIDRKVLAYREQLDMALLRIIAGILDVPLRDLKNRDKAYQLEKVRRRNRQITGVALVMTLLATAAVVAGFLAVQKQFEAHLNQGKALFNQANGHVNATEYPQAQLVAALALGFDQFDGKERPSPPFWKVNADKTYPNALIPNNRENSRLIGRLARIASGQVSTPLSPLPVWCSQTIPMPRGETENPAWAAVFSPDYRWIAAGSEDGSVRIYSWDQPNFEPRLLPSPGGWNHQAIRDLKISPTGNRLAVAYEGRRTEKDFFALWEIDRSAPLQPRFVHSGNQFYHNIDSLDFSPDGTQIVTAGGPTWGDGKAAIWDIGKLATGPIFEVNLAENWVNDVSWSPTGDRIAVACHRMVQIIDPENGQLAGPPLHLYPNDTDFGSLAFSDTGEYLAAAASNRELFIWRITSRGFELMVNQSIHRYPVRDLVFTPGGSGLVTSSGDGIVKVWNIEHLPDMALEASLLADSSTQKESLPAIRALAVSPDGNFILTGLIDSTLRIWSLGRRQSLVFQKSGNVESVSRTQENHLLATALESLEGDQPSGHFEVLDLERESLLWTRTFPLPKRDGFALRLETRFLSGAKRLLTFRRPLGPNEKDYIELFDTASGQLIDATSLETGIFPRAAAFSDSGGILLATPEGNCYFSRFDPENDRLPKPGDFKPIADANKDLQKVQVWDVELSEDATLAVMTGRQERGDNRISFVHIMDPINLVTLFPTSAGPNVAMCAAFSPDGRELAVGTFDQHLIYLFDTETGKMTDDPLKGHDRGITALRYDSSGTRLASGSQNQIRIWDPRTRDEIAAIDAHSKMVQDFAWETPEGGNPLRLISGAEDQTLKIWTLPSVNPNLRSYLDGAPYAWLNFNTRDATLEWNSAQPPHPGFVNLSPLSTIGRIANRREDSQLDWYLFIESVRAGNWDSATVLFHLIPPEFRNRRSMIMDQSTSRALDQLRLQAALPDAPIPFINRRTDQILALLPQEGNHSETTPLGTPQQSLRQEINLLKDRVNRQASGPENQ